MPQRVLTRDERLLERLGMYTPAMLDALSESRERERFKNLMIQVIRRKPWLSSFLVGMGIHTGRQGLEYTQTACAWVDPTTLRFNMAFNPFFMRALQKVDVQRGRLPIDPTLAKSLEDANYKVSSFEKPPLFVQLAMQEAGHGPRGPNEWVAVRTDVSMQIAVVEHELAHILHNHIQQFHDRGLWPDAQILNLAMDVAINQDIDNLPPEAVTIESYANDPHYPLELPKKDAFDTYYKILAEYYKGAERGQVPKGPKTKSPIQGFVAGTLVAVPGGTKPIEAIRANDRVLTFDSTGALVQRFVLRTKNQVAGVHDTPELLATDMFQLETTNHEFDRISGKAKVWVEGVGWQGVGEPTTFVDLQRGTSTPRVPVAVGDLIRIRQANSYITEPVTRIGTQSRRPNETLYQLAVRPIDGPSSFIANGIVVKGLDLVKTPPTAPADPNAPPPPESPPDDDDDILTQPPPSKGGSGQGKAGKGDPSEGEPGKGEPGEGEPGGGEPGEGQLDKSGEGPSQPGKTTPGERIPPKRLQAPVDDHSTWNAIPPRLQREAIRRLTKGAIDRMKKSGQYGTLPGYMHSLIEEILAEPQIDWRNELRGWVGGKVRKSLKRTRKRPSRRHGWLLPGTKVQRGATIWFAVDNSGSIGVKEAEQFAAEFIDILRDGNDGVLIVWDTEIRQIKPIRNTTDLEEAFRDLGGGGGSTGAPKIFEALAHPERLTGPDAVLLAKKPTGIVVLTDGYIQWPNPGANLNVPTLWGITSESNLGDQPFGDALYIELKD